MSYIVRELTCTHCGKTFTNLWHSFGHPEKNFEWYWRCSQCEGLNVRTIPAMYGGFGTEIPKDLSDRKAEEKK